YPHRPGACHGTTAAPGPGCPAQTATKDGPMSMTLSVRPVALLFTFPVAALFALAGTPARADLRFAQPIASAGEVRTGIPLAHRFTYVNEGPEAVEITETRGSCGCLTPRLAQRVLQPGETGTLVLEVNTLSQDAGYH